MKAFYSFIRKESNCPNFIAFYNSFGISSLEYCQESCPKIECSVYNRGKRELFFAIELLRHQLCEKLIGFENYFVVDSVPLEVVKLSRNKNSKICNEEIL